MTQTAMIKWWQKIAFWTKIKLLLIPFSLGEALAVYFADGHKALYALPAIAYFVIYMIDNFIKDEDKDGIVDGLEKKKE